MPAGEKRTPKDRAGNEIAGSDGGGALVVVVVMVVLVVRLVIRSTLFLQQSFDSEHIDKLAMLRHRCGGSDCDC